ncbi:hypothetical protein EYF80_049918 [Liparis tanakae]|uniref:Uncharacterized protein n=1 Tax=Liparis tanakae TaxID=230148 RepID=A0A4Z2FFH9_9TELE|nr:hypothetical protein EYF80_049918 [Liparis tanakae]
MGEELGLIDILYGPQELDVTCGDRAQSGDEHSRQEDNATPSHVCLPERTQGIVGDPQSDSGFPRINPVTRSLQLHEIMDQETPHGGYTTSSVSVRRPPHVLPSRPDARAVTRMSSFSSVYLSLRFPAATSTALTALMP